MTVVCCNIPCIHDRDFEMAVHNYSILNNLLIQENFPFTCFRVDVRFMSTNWGRTTFIKFQNTSNINKGIRFNLTFEVVAIFSLQTSAHLISIYFSTPLNLTFFFVKFYAEDVKFILWLYYGKMNFGHDPCLIRISKKLRVSNIDVFIDFLRITLGRKLPPVISCT